MPYASGKRALGICDNCGFQFKLNQLKYNIVGGIRTKERVCKECLDPYNPRDRPTSFVAKTEAIAVRDPRPDTQADELNSIGGFNPVVGFEVFVWPGTEGARMTNCEFVLGPQYLLTETGYRLETEDGHLIDLG